MSTLNQAFSTGGGLATEATLLDVKTAVESIDTKVATETTLALLEGKDFATQTTLQSVATDIDSLEANFGNAADAAASSDTGTFSFMSFVKRSLQKLTLINTDTTAMEGWLNQLNGVFGLQSDAAASTDTGTFSFMSFVKRVLQKLTLINTDTTSSASSLTSLAGAVSGTELQVDVVASLPAGNNNIGDVDVASLPVAFNAGNASATTQRVVIATDQAAVATKAPVNTNGSVANTTLTATTASTATAPANAVGFILYADTDNTNTIRFAIGATASTSVGSKLEPGRDTGYLPCAANVSVCAITSGTNAFSIQWILSA